MNPYQTPPDGNDDSASDLGAKEHPRESDEELRRRQLQLVIRLGGLSVVTTVAAVTLFVVTGFDATTSAVLLALVLGIGFTVSWRA